MPTDSDPKKWAYPEHTRVKHELLEKYLGGWLPILGSHHSRLVIIDGFAGRGQYTDGSDGSPVVILRKAQELISGDRVKEVVCGFVERDPGNFANLKSVLGNVKSLYPDVGIAKIENEAFEKVASRIINDVGDKIAPSFWFIDPFGFTGLPFSVIEGLMSLSRSEVFITLMLRDIGRFLSHSNLEAAFDSLFGTPQWRGIVYTGKTGDAKEKELRDLYVAQLRSLGCKVTLFRVSMDQKLQTIYYMIHATKHPKGRRLMKDVMYGQGVDGVFAYLGPQDQSARMQSTLFASDPIPALRTGLLRKYSGRTISFEDLRNECCDEDELRDPDYRKALKELRDDKKIEVTPVTSTTSRGLRGNDQIAFPAI